MGKAAVPCRWELRRGASGEQPGQGKAMAFRDIPLLRKRCRNLVKGNVLGR